VKPRSQRVQPSPSEAAVLTTALRRAADRLDIPNTVLAKSIGLSESTVSRLRRGDYVLQPGHKSFELAVLVVRLYRSLDSIVAEDAAATAWLRSTNTALGGEPIRLLQSVSGLVNVIAYLDSRRAVV
jgi:hypothetical protein